MDAATLEGRLEFIPRPNASGRAAQQRPQLRRPGRKAASKRRLCLMAMLFQDGLRGWIRCACCSCAWFHDLGDAAIVRDAHPGSASAATCCNWPAA